MRTNEVLFDVLIRIISKVNLVYTFVNTLNKNVFLVSISLLEVKHRTRWPFCNFTFCGDIVLIFLFEFVAGLITAMMCFTINACTVDFQALKFFNFVKSRGLTITLGDFKNKDAINIWLCRLVFNHY